MTMKKYTVRAGYSCKGDDAAVKGPGEEVELSDDVVRNHPGAFELVPGQDEAEPAEPAAA